MNWDTNEGLLLGEIKDLQDDIKKLKHQLIKLREENILMKEFLMSASNATCYTEYEDACSDAGKLLEKLEAK
jgi:hypothetical protein